MRATNIHKTGFIKLRAPAALLALSLMLESMPAHAYLDPGTGSMLLSVVVGLVSGAYFVIRKLPATLRALFFRLTGKTDRMKGSDLTFYAESAAYWMTFKPMVWWLVSSVIRWLLCVKRKVARRYSISVKDWSNS